LKEKYNLGSRHHKVQIRTSPISVQQISHISLWHPAHALDVRLYRMSCSWGIPSSAHFAVVVGVIAGVLLVVVGWVVGVILGTVAAGATGAFAALAPFAALAALTS